MTRNVSRNPTRRYRSATARRRLAAMTLVEIMIVVVIMALIATAVGVAVLPQLSAAKEKVAATDVSTIKQAAIAYVLDGGDGCPTVDDLMESGELDEDASPVDPWGTNPYEIECNGDNVAVTSAGPDEQFDTEDDITTSRRRRE